MLVSSPGMEPHIRPFQVSGCNSYLPTSPEFSMKKLLAGGLGNIFQINSAFRNEPASNTHLPEFSLLEFYRAPGSIEEICQDIEEWVCGFAKVLNSSETIHYQGKKISLSTPWKRLTTESLFNSALDIQLSDSDSREQFIDVLVRNGFHNAGDPGFKDKTWDDLYFEVWLNLIEPHLPHDRPIFITDYPPSQAALAEIKTDEQGNRWASRAEFYVGGLELGNGFQELTDPIEQRRRFEEDMNLRQKVYGKDFPKSPIDEEFISALEQGLPRSSGIAVGLDRLVMLFSDESDIRYTTWLLPSVSLSAR